MPFVQIVVDLDGTDPAAAEDACFADGALAVTLADAADHPVLEPAPGATPLWPTVRLTALFAQDVDAPGVVERLAGSLGLDSWHFRCEDVEDRAWEREWLRDFRPMRFGRRLWICPGGQAVDDPAAVVLELDPGLAFGTGTHPTTAMCLEWLDGADLQDRTVLDYGCGSGVLALAALRLGAGAACAVDIDPQALLATGQNADRNQLAHCIRICAADGLQEGAWDVVMANILAGPLVDLAPELAARTRVAGHVVLAGMLNEQAGDVAAAYRPWFDMSQFSSRDGWTVLAGRRRDPSVE